MSAILSASIQYRSKEVNTDDTAATIFFDLSLPVHTH